MIYIDDMELLDNDPQLTVLPVHVRAHVWAHRVRQFEVTWPADWRQWLKERWAPGWVKRRWPVRRQRRIVNVYRVYDPGKVEGERMALGVPTVWAGKGDTFADLSYRHIHLERRHLSMFAEVSAVMYYHPEERAKLKELIAPTFRRMMARPYRFTRPANWREALYEALALRVPWLYVRREPRYTGYRFDPERFAGIYPDETRGHFPTTVSIEVIECEH